MSRRTGVWKKYLAYSSVNFGFSLLGMTATMLLMYYYTDVLMLPALSVSVILFSARLFDGVVDPFLGHFMDGRTTKFGKYRGYVIYWGPLACVAFALMFSGSPFEGAGKVAWCLALYFIFILAFSFVEIASLPMLASFGTKESRSAGNTLKITACIVATLIAAMSSMKLVRVLGENSEQAGYSRMAILFAGAAMATLLLGGLGFKEGRYASEDRAGAVGECGVKKAISIVLRERSIALLLCMHLCMDAASAFKMQGGIYYLKYNIARPDLIGLFLSGSIVVSLLSQPLVFFCSRRFKARVLMTYGCGVSAAAMLLIGLSGSSIPLIMAGNCLFGVASAFPANLIFSHMLELSERLGEKQGKPFGGIVNSFIGLASRIGCSLASAVLSLVLFATAYLPNEAQSDLTLWGISIGFIALPIAVLIIGGVCASLSCRTLESDAVFALSGDILSRDVAEAEGN